MDQIKTWRFWIIPSLVAAVLVYGIFYPVLEFTLAWDDWILYWGSRYNPSILHAYWAHPGTMLEFLALSKLLSPYSSIWMHIGLILKITVSLASGKLLYSLTKSKLASVFAVIVVSVSYIGLDAVEIVFAHVILFSTAVICLGISYWIKYLEKASKTALILTYVFFLLALIADLFRLGSVLIIVALLIPVFSTKETSKKSLMVITSLIIIFIIFSFIFKYFYLPLHLDTQLTRELISGISLYRLKVYVLNYFSSIGAIFYSWIAHFPDGGGKWINRIFYITGIIVLPLSLFLIIKSYKDKNKNIFVIGFLLLWILIFYVSPWIYEPRLIPNPTHRYILLPGLGLQMLIAFSLSFLRNKRILFTAFSLLFLFTVNTSLKRVYEQYYRNKKSFKLTWNYINDATSKNSSPILLYLTGEDPFYTYTFKATGAFPIAISKKITATDKIPIVFYSMESAVSALCKYYSTDNQIPEETITRLYAFDINHEGHVKNITKNIREELQRNVQIQDCHDLINQ